MLYRLVSSRAPRQIGAAMSVNDWFQLALAIYIISFFLVMMGLHHGGFENYISDPRVRRTFGILALVLAPETIMIYVVVITYLGLRLLCREVAIYTGIPTRATHES